MTPGDVPLVAALIASEGTAERASVARYRRDARGETVHRADCRSLRGRGSAWHFADGMTADQIVQTLASAHWLTACKICRPDEQGVQ